MKKFFTLAALLATCWCSSSATVYTDVINYANVKAQNEAAVDAGLDDRFDHPENINAELSYYSDQSFTSYSLKKVFTITGTNDYMTESSLLFTGDEAGVYNANAPMNKWIKSVTVNTFEGYYYSSMVYVFTSDAEFDYSQRYDNTVSNQYSYMNGTSATFNIAVPAQYLYIDCKDGFIKDITIEWTDEKPTPTVATPVFECWDDPKVPGSNVYVKTATVGATINVDVKINGEDDGVERVFTQESEWGSGSFQLPGNPGDVITVTAVASKEGWVDSESVTETYTLDYPPCPGVLVNYESYLSYVVSGKTATFAVAKQNEEGAFVDIAGAKITYSYTWFIPGTDVNGASAGETTVDAPYDFAIPTDIPVGAYIKFSFKESAPGYSDTTSGTYDIEVVSSKIEVPSLSSSPTDVEKGSTLTLKLPRFANKLYYIINDGEEQVTEFDYEFTANEDMKIEAWATGEVFEASDKVTYEITLEKLTENIDVILPGNENTYSKEKHYTTGSEHNGANEYLYYGAYWHYYMNDRPYFDQSDPTGTDYNFVANLTAGEYEITGIRVDSPDNTTYGAMVAVYLADEPLVTVADDGTIYRAEGTELNYPNYSVTGRPGYFVICAEGHQNYDVSTFLRAGDFNEWIDIKAAQAMQIEEGFASEDQPELSFEHRKFFLIRPWKQNTTVFRYLIRYSSPVEGVTAIDADLDTEEQAVYYNLNGVRVDGELTPGLYIRVTPASTTKVLVK